MGKTKKTAEEKKSRKYQRNKRSRDRILEEQKPGTILKKNPDYAAIVKTIQDEG